MKIQSATKVFGALEKWLWSCHDIKIATKIKEYNAVVLPSLLYSTETMILYLRYFKKRMRSICSKYYKSSGKIRYWM